jgi:predicted CoA-binding protein
MRDHPTDETGPTEGELRRIYETTRTIAVVGASNHPGKAAHNIPVYLQRQGFRIIPVNPTSSEVLGEQAYASLEDVEEPVDVVDVFRPAEEAPAIARQAAAAGAKVLWLQAGIVSEEAADIAREAGLTVVMDRCMGETHYELYGPPD